MTELHVCARCGAQRPRTEMGTMEDQEGIRYYCHPFLSVGPTCYVRATWESGSHWPVTE